MGISRVKPERISRFAFGHPFHLSPRQQATLVPDHKLESTLCTIVSGLTLLSITLFNVNPRTILPLCHRLHSSFPFSTGSDVHEPVLCADKAIMGSSFCFYPRHCLLSLLVLDAFLNPVIPLHAVFVPLSMSREVKHPNPTDASSIDLASYSYVRYSPSFSSVPSIHPTHVHPPPPPTSADR